MLAVVVIVSLVAARRPDRLTLLLGLTILAIAFYVVPTRVHERYAYPAFALAVILAAIAWRWRVAYLALSVTVFLNMYAALTNPFYDNPGISDWLGIGPTLRTELPVAILAVVNGVVFLWAFAQLRPSAHGSTGRGARRRVSGALGGRGRGRAGGEAGARRRPTAASTAHAASQPTTGRTGRRAGRARPPRRLRRRGGHHAALDRPRHLRRARRRRLVQGPLQRPAGPARPDGHAPPRGRRPARPARPVDRRRADPRDDGAAHVPARPSRYQMHFDEVYHARTATEFLQDWRYGLSHDIYEWTHPHLAKYLMAGRDRALGRGPRRAPRATSGCPSWPPRSRRAGSTRSRRRAGGELGRPRRRAAPHRHRDRDPDLRPQDPRADLDRHGARARPRWPSTTPTSGWSSATTTDASRRSTSSLIGDGGVSTGLEPTALAKVDHPVDHLLVVNGGTQVDRGLDRPADLGRHGSTGRSSGRSTWPASPTSRRAGAAPALVATVDEVTDPAAVASSLAIDPRDRARPISRARSRRRRPGRRVVLGDPGTGDARTKLDAAIADGTLPGDPGRLRDPGRGRDGCRRRVRRSRRGVGGDDDQAGRRRARPGAWSPDSTTRSCTRRPAARRSRATTSSRSVATRPRTARPTRVSGLGLQPLPGPGTWVAYDAASQMVHILGLAPGVTSAAGPWTVYVVEPHGNAVYADARLPDGFVAERLGRRLQPGLPVRGPPAAPAVRRRRRVGLDRCRLARLRLAAARGHRRRADRGAALPADPDPVPAPADRRHWSACSSSPTGCSSSSRGSA